MCGDFAYLLRIGTNDIWIGLTKPSDTCGKFNSSCRRLGWNWEDGTPYNTTQYSWYDGQLQEPQAGELCAKLKQSHLYGMSCQSQTQLLQCLCEKLLVQASTWYGCPIGWKMYKDSCYLMTHGDFSQPDCKKTCKKEESVIASITNHQENVLLTNL